MTHTQPTLIRASNNKTKAHTPTKYKDLKIKTTSFNQLLSETLIKIPQTGQQRRKDIPVIESSEILNNRWSTIIISSMNVHLYPFLIILLGQPTMKLLLLRIQRAHNGKFTVRRVCRGPSQAAPPDCCNHSASSDRRRDRVTLWNQVGRKEKHC